MANVIKQPCDEGVIESTPISEQCSKIIGFWILVATIIGSSMAFIDSTVVNVALPALQSELNATVVDVQWVVESYALFLAALILVGGSLGDKFGRRRIFAIGILLFAAASVLCGLAQNVFQLILARAVQGVGGALMIPGSLAIIGAYFGDEDRGKAIGTWSGFSAITASIGPVFGGWLIENASWRWIFFINIPLALIVLFILYWRVPESKDEEASFKLDWLGALLVTIGLGGVVIGLLESPILGFSHPLVFGLLIIGIIALIFFIFIEKKSDAPMMPLTLFESRTFSGANLVTLLLYGALGGALFFIPFKLIQVEGYTATAAGAAFLPLILIIFILSRWSGGLVDKYGARNPLIIGPIIAAIGYVIFAVQGIGGSYWTTLFPAMVVLGLGMAISVAPVTTAVLGSVDKRYSGIASGVNNATSRIAGLLAIAFLGLFVLSMFNKRLDNHMLSIEMKPEAQQVFEEQRIRLAAAEIPNDIKEEAKVKLQYAINESFVYGLRYIFFISAGLSLASAFIAWLSIEKIKPGHS